MTAPATPAPAPFRRTLESRLAQIAVVTEALDEWAEGAGVPPSVAGAIGLMLDELITNIVTHGYGGEGPHPIGLEVEVDGRSASVTLTDHAPAFDPLQAALPDITLDIEKRDIGGLGVFFVRRMADEISYRRIGEGTDRAGNELRFVKRFPAPKVAG